MREGGREGEYAVCESKETGSEHVGNLSPHIGMRMRSSVQGGNEREWPTQKGWPGIEVAAAIEEVTRSLSAKMEA